ncbi:peroxiredoxin [Halomicrobium sp. HM KBTZ05]|uniref:thioredoxin-dependent peroxiredoxin n=1 Tax=Halomicrobium mukohataei TaxID=57705 RepID=A0A847UE20_9EURY|nr:peroxiredoxin [Halomicrobium mukohataei]NLV09271.1 redoxin domain-containing protein [Halomicrobium mukohataei]
MVLDTGSDAPAISARNQRGERVEPDFGGATVLYFYPRDDTDGCTTQARQFDDHYDTYRDAGIPVYGVSTDDVDSHRAFAEDHDLAFDLLADPDGEIADAFDVPLDDGRAVRTTFVIAAGRVVGLYEGVRPDGHARDVLRDLAELGLVDPAE